MTSNPQRAGSHERAQRLVAPLLRLHVDIELDFVSVRILDVNAVTHAVVRHPDDRHTGSAQLRDRTPELVVTFSDLETKVIKAKARLRWNRRRAADFDQQQLVMSAAGRKRCRHRTVRRDFFPSKRRSVKAPRPLEVFDVKHDMSEILHQHDVSPALWFAHDAGKI